MLVCTACCCRGSLWRSQTNKIHRIVHGWFDTQAVSPPPFRSTLSCRLSRCIGSSFSFLTFIRPGHVPKLFAQSIQKKTALLRLSGYVAPKSHHNTPPTSMAKKKRQHSKNSTPTFSPPPPLLPLSADAASTSASSSPEPPPL